MFIDIAKAKCPLLHNIDLLHLLDSHQMTYEIRDDFSIHAKFRCCLQWRVVFETIEDKHGMYIRHKSGKGHKYTDFNEIVPIVLSTLLNLEGVCTVRHIGELSFCSDTEIDEMILLIMQPHFQHLDIANKWHLKLIDRVLFILSYLHKYFYQFFQCTIDESLSNPIYGSDVHEEWLKVIIKKNNYHDTFVVSRTVPDWTYLRVFNPEIVICRAHDLCVTLKNIASSNNYKPQKLQGVDAEIYINKTLKNTAPAKEMSIINQIFYELNDTSHILILVQENHILCISDFHIICFYCSTSIYSFYEEKRKITERQRLENNLLLMDRNFVWNIDSRKKSSRFEELTLELLRREAHIKSVKLASSTNEPDNGRDLIFEYEKDYFTESKRKGKVTNIRNGIVQCKTKLKASKKQSVGWSDVNDLYNALIINKPDAYFLVVNTQITAQLTNTLEALRKMSEFKLDYVDWWCKNDLEDRLRDNPDILARYRDIVDYEQGK